MTFEHWSNYWHTGVMTSLPEDFNNNYDGEIKEFWKKQLLKILNKNSISILDVCTGNAALPVLFTDFFENLDCKIEITAIDASVINKEKINHLLSKKNLDNVSIKCFSNCKLEEVTKEHFGQFDLVTSQYGVEYCDELKISETIYSILKQNGMFCAVTHHSESAMLEYMEQEEIQYKYLEHLGMFDLFARFSKSKISANGFKNKLKKILEANNHPVSSIVQAWMEAAYQILNTQNKKLTSQKKRAEQFLNQYKFARLRSLDLIKVSLKLADSRKWSQTFIDQGFKLEEEGEIFYKKKHNSGKYFIFQK